MLIILIWLGSVLPDKYFNTINRCEEYPQNQCVLLGEAHYNHYINKYRSMLNVSDARISQMIMVERADVLRLLYLYDKGGVYSDMDNVIDYPASTTSSALKMKVFSARNKSSQLFQATTLYMLPNPETPK